jgi:mannose-6-phosphate isomerase-like protein (cupin superfamily)
VGEVYATIKHFEDDSNIDDYRIAVSKSALELQPLQGSKVRFEKLFQDGSYVACGVMDILVGGAKGVKSTKHSFMTFVVMTGRAEVKINRTAFVIGKGGVFVVPRGIVPCEIALILRKCIFSQEYWGYKLSVILLAGSGGWSTD